MPDWTCGKAHTNPASADFCSQCGEARPVTDWTCSNGHVNAGTGKFCPTCGEAASFDWTCPEGHVNLPTNRFCGKCGIPRTATTTEKATTTAETRGDVNWEKTKAWFKRNW